MVLNDIDTTTGIFGDVLPVWVVTDLQRQLVHQNQMGDLDYLVLHLQNHCFASVLVLHVRELCPTFGATMKSETSWEEVFMMHE